MYFDRHVLEDQLTQLKRDDFDEVLLAGPNGTFGSTLWRRPEESASATRSRRRLIVRVADAHSASTAERIGAALH